MVPVGDPQAPPPLSSPLQQEAPAPTTAQLARELSFQGTLGSLRVHLISLGDLRAPIPATTTSSEQKESERSVYAKVSVDPGSECATSAVLSIENCSNHGAWDQTLSLQVTSLACISSLNTVVHLVVEIWELSSSSLSHELIGSGHIALRKLVVNRRNHDHFELALVRKSGRGYAGKITLSAVFEVDVSSTNIRPFGSSVWATCGTDDSDGSAEERGVKGELIVAVLACGGLKNSSLLPFITAELAGEKSEPQRTEVGLWSIETLAPDGEIPEFPAPVAVWNHHFRFDLDLPTGAAARALSLQLKLMDESICPSQALASTQMDLANWNALFPVNQSVKCVSVTAAAHEYNDEAPANPLQLLLACFWFPSSRETGSGDEFSEVQPRDTTHEASSALLPSPNNHLLPSALPPQSLPLGSSLALSISGICQLPTTIFDKLVASGEASEVIARGKLLPSGGASQAVLPVNNSIQVDSSHCDSNNSSSTTSTCCFQFRDADRIPIVLGFELAPTVFDALQFGTEALRVEVEIRSKRSREWSSLSFCVGLASLFAQGRIQAQEMPSQFKLLDGRGNFAGMVCTAIGINTSSSSESTLYYPLAKTITPLSRAPPPVRVTLRVQDLNSSNSLPAKVFVKVWSSSNGRQLAFKSSPISWDSSGSNKPPGSDQAAVFEIPHASTEVFFVELYRFSHHERNEILGSCSFSLPSELLQDYQAADPSASSRSTEVKQWMRLSSVPIPSQPRASKGIANVNKTCGETLLAMHIHNCSSTPLASSSLSVASLSKLKAASSILSEVKYNALSGGLQNAAENRRVLEVHVMDAYPPAHLETLSSNGDSLQVRLRLAASQWSEQSSFQDLVQINAKGDRRVSWNEQFTTSSVSWSSKDRLVPALKFELFVRSSNNSNPGSANKKPQVPLGSSLLSSSGALSLTVKSNSRSRQQQRNRIPESTEGNERRLGGCTLDLCALFAQPTTSSSVCLLLLIPVDQFAGDDRVERVPSEGTKMIPVLVRMRLTTPTQLTAGTLQSDPEVTRPPLLLKGDVCIHVGAASGSFLRRTDGMLYFVSASFGSESVSTRSQAATASSDTTTTSTTTTGNSNNTVEWDEQLVLPVCCAATPIIELQVFRKQTLSEVRGELVGSCSLPLFPSITHEQHLVAFTLPLASPSADGSSRGELRKEGSLEFEIQFLDHLKSDKLEAALTRPEERVELVIHQLKGLTGEGNGLLPPSLASSALLQVLKLSAGGTERQQLSQPLVLLYETSISVLRRPSGDGGDTIDIGGDHRVDLTAAVADIQGHEGAVLALQVCDIERRNPLGHVHFPLRKGWREHLIESQKKYQRAWYSLHQSIDKQQQQQQQQASKAQVQLTFAIVSARNSANASANQPDREQIAGKLYVQVKESLLSLTSSEGSVQIQPGASACVQLRVTRGHQQQVLKRGRTRKALLRDRERSWAWTNETFAFDQLLESPYDALQFELVAEALGGSLSGSIEIERFVQLGLETSEEWVTLTTRPACTITDSGGDVNSVELEAQLLIHTTFLPALTGVFELTFGAIRPLSGSQSSFRISVEKSFFKCIWKRKSFATAMVDTALLSESEVAVGLSKQQTIEIPFDSRDGGNDSSSRGEIPVLLVQWMGFASAFQEFCLGECTLELHAFLAKPDSEPQFKWYLLYDKHEKSKRTGFVSMSATFRAFRAQPSKRRGGGAGASKIPSNPAQLGLSSLTRARHTVAKSESLLLWKKLFYHLDANGNGRIDVSEFKQVFLSHKDVLASSTDGQNLMQSLFGSTTGSSSSRISNTGALLSPSEAQIKEFFSEMDANHDQEIEWSEYVNFLLRKQQEHDAHVSIIDGDDGEGDKPSDGSQFAQLPIEDSKKMRELRAKRREDTNASHRSPVAPVLGQPSPATTTTTTSTTAATTQARKRRPNSSIPPPPFSPMASSTSKAKEVSPRKPEVSSLGPSSQQQREYHPMTPPSPRGNEYQTSKSSATRALASPNTHVSNEQLDLLRSQLDTLKERLDAKDQENAHLKHELSAVQTIHTLDQQKYANLSAEYQQLQRNFQVLQLARQREAIQAETKAVHVQQTIAKHNQLLQDREKQRKHHHEASIVLQSKIRSRFEQKRFQARKLQRANAVVTLQCFFRVRRARKTLKKLQTADRMERNRARAALRLQRFVRAHLKRKARAMMRLAQQLSAQIIQKHARRFVRVRSWDRQKRAILMLQCWVRQRLASRLCKRFRNAKCIIDSVIRLWICKWRYRKAWKMVQRLQLWWRRTARQLAGLRARNGAALSVQVCWRRWQCRLRQQQEEILIEHLEAAVCVQALWRGRRARKDIEMEQKRREEYMERLEAAVCIQAVWKEHRAQKLVVRLQDNHGDTVIRVVENGGGSVGNSDHEVDRAAADDDVGASIDKDRVQDAAASLTVEAHDEQDEPTDEKDLSADEMALTGDQTAGDECLPPDSEDSQEPDEDEGEEESEKGGEANGDDQESGISEDAASPEDATESKRDANMTVAPDIPTGLLFGPDTEETSMEEMVKMRQSGEMREQEKSAVGKEVLVLQSVVAKEVAGVFQRVVDEICSLDLLEDADMLEGNEAHTEREDSVGGRNENSNEMVEFAGGQGTGDECLPFIESEGPLEVDEVKVEEQKNDGGGGSEDEGGANVSPEESTTDPAHDPDLAAESIVEADLLDLSAGGVRETVANELTVMQELDESAADKQVVTLPPAVEKDVVEAVLQCIANQVCDLNPLEDREEVADHSDNGGGSPEPSSLAELALGVDFAVMDASDRIDRDSSLLVKDRPSEQHFGEPDEGSSLSYDQSTRVIKADRSGHTTSSEAHPIRLAMDAMLAALEGDHLRPKNYSKEKDGPGTLWTSDAETSRGSIASMLPAASVAAQKDLEVSAKDAAAGAEVDSSSSSKDLDLVELDSATSLHADAAAALPRDESDPSCSTGVEGLRDLGSQEAVGAEAHEQTSDEQVSAIPSVTNAVPLESHDQIPGSQETNFEDSKSMPSEDEVSRPAIATPSKAHSESSATEIAGFGEDREQPKNDNDDSDEESDRAQSSSVDSNDLM